MSKLTALEKQGWTLDAVDGKDLKDGAVLKVLTKMAQAVTGLTETVAAIAQDVDAKAKENRAVMLKMLEIMNRAVPQTPQDVQKIEIMGQEGGVQEVRVVPNSDKETTHKLNRKFNGEVIEIISTERQV